MPSLKEIRTRIASVRSTRKITDAMKMVAASRLRRVQNHIVHLRQYASMLKDILNDMMHHVPFSGYSVYMKERDTKDVLLVCIGSNRGLCGTYNTFLIKRTLSELYALREEGYEVKLMAIGKKIERFFAKREFELIASGHHILEKADYETAQGFAEQIMDLYLKHNLQRVIIVYNRFKNAVVHELTTEQVLPVPGESMVLDEEAYEGFADDFPLILEPNQGDAVDYMTRQYIYYNHFRILLEATASENGSRMTAMHKATDNADEMLKSLTLLYNKARQASVTRELMDIVGGSAHTGN